MASKPINDRLTINRWSLVQHSDASGPAVFNVSKVEIHPEFDWEKFSNNLAVVKLSQEVKLRESAQQICLSTVAEHQVGGVR
jgi:hypothetical protein